MTPEKSGSPHQVIVITYSLSVFYNACNLRLTSLGSPPSASGAHLPSTHTALHSLTGALYWDLRVLTIHEGNFLFVCKPSAVPFPRLYSKTFFLLPLSRTLYLLLILFFPTHTLFMYLLLFVCGC
jgi:hypothetical protein